MRVFLRSSGREYQKNDPAVTVDYNTGDPVVRWDSYENFNERYQDSLEGNKPTSATVLPWATQPVYILHKTSNQSLVVLYSIHSSYSIG